MLSNRHFRVGATLLLVASISNHRLLAQTISCDNFPFPNKAFPIRYKKENLPKPLQSKAEDLYLSGVGMRRKNFFIVDVDVYEVGLCLSKENLVKGQKAIQSGESLANALYKNGKILPDKIAEIAIPLKFVRYVSTTQIVEAFNDSFVGCSQDGIDLFKDALRSIVGKAGLALGQEMTFYWLRGGGLVIAKDGEIAEVIYYPELEKRLLEVYIDPNRSVSPDLINCISAHIQNIKV